MESIHTLSKQQHMNMGTSLARPTLRNERKMKPHLERPQTCCTDRLRAQILDLQTEDLAVAC